MIVSAGRVGGRFVVDIAPGRAARRPVRQ